jgi:hypothetical protein
MTQPFTTRAEAEALQGLDPAIVEKMAERAYERTRSPSFPPWSDVEPTYRRQLRAEIVAAVKAGEQAGYLKIRGAA